MDEVNKNQTEQKDSTKPQEIVKRILQMIAGQSIENKRIIVELLKQELRAKNTSTFSTFSITAKKNGKVVKFESSSGVDLARKIAVQLYPSLAMLGQKLNPSLIFFGRETQNWRSQASIDFLKKKLIEAGFEVET